MRIIRSFTLILITLLVSSCFCCSYQKHPPVEVRGDFNSMLSTKYRMFADKEAAKYDWMDSEHFGKKSLELARGKYVMPEDPRRWDVGLDPLDDLWVARERLLSIMCDCMTSKFPSEMAELQFSYDCWVEETAEGKKSDIKTCRQRFEKALTEMEHKNGLHCAGGEKGGCEYVIHYDLDKDAIVDEHKPVMNSILHNLRGMSNYHIYIQGHTDTLQSDTYNIDLGRRRAANARDYLVGQGVDKDKISIETVGEHKLAVPTPDETYKRANRRSIFRITTGK